MLNRVIFFEKTAKSLFSGDQAWEEGGEGSSMADQSDFLRYFLQHQLDLRAFIGAMIRDRAAQDDVFQEVALILWRQFANYDQGRSFGAWARGIAANKVMHYWREQRRQPAPFSPETVQALLDAYEQQEQQQPIGQEGLKPCMDRLPGKSRELLELRYQQGLALATIATRLNSTTNAIHMALSRIRQKLAECLKRYQLSQGRSVSHE
jgi:RNA polymerase sigma-70 factor (ECF subfamily)